MTNKSIINQDEVDLIDIFSIIWKNKWTIILLTSILLFLTFIGGFLLKNKNLKTIATTEIRGITLYENKKYEVYNKIINSIKPEYKIIENKIDPEYLITEGKYFNKYITENYQFFKYININDINKKFLLNLFLDQLNQEENIKYALVKSGLFKKEDYSTEFELESKLNNFTSKILLSHSTIDEKSENAKKYLTAELNSYQVENWEKFLKYLEKSTNDVIREKLIEIFEDHTNYMSLLNKYIIEDIQARLETIENQDLIKELNDEKNILLTNNFIKRTNEIFNDSPISKADKFYAAKIIYDSTKYDVERDIFSSKKFYILIAIIGLILSTILVLFSNALKNRK